MPFLPNIGPVELILLLVIALVIFGPGKLPDIANSLGKSVREFRRAASDVSDAAKGEVDKPATTPADAAAGPAPNALANASEPNRLADSPAAQPASTDAAGDKPAS